MYRRHGNKLALLFLAGDLATTAGAWMGAYGLRFAWLPSPQGTPDVDLVVAGLPLVLALSAIVYRVCGLYEAHRLRELSGELGLIIKASGLLFAMVITATFYRRDLYESRLALSLFFALNAVGLVVFRRLVWRLLKALRGRGLNQGRALIVGTGRTARNVARAIQRNSWTGLEAIGFVDAAGKAEPALLPRLGTVEQIESIAAQYDIDHVFVALPLARYGELPAVYRALDGVLAEVHLVPDVPELAGMRLRMMEIDGLAFLGIRESPHYGWHRLAKRAMDLALAAVALVVAAPLMLLIAAAIKLTSPGPVFYRQARAGLRGRTFAMLKFRSMAGDAERLTGPVWACRGDRRCTAVGKMLRRWSLDELPQLFNVLAGDMSLVGPRPERGVFIEKFRRQIPGYAQRHRVPSGITGWAQVHGWRGNTSLRHRVRCDLYYIAHWSIGLDLKILLLTLWRGLRHRNAY